jgi:hypothetical protein
MTVGLQCTESKRIINAKDSVVECPIRLASDKAGFAFGHLLDSRPGHGFDALYP